MIPAGQVMAVSNSTLKPVPDQTAAGATWVSLITSGSGPVTVAPQ
jgi:hypothetical protein